MLDRCDHCHLIQPNDRWSCRQCGALMRVSRTLLRWLLGLAVALTLVLLYSALAPLFP
jgi:uncharacterized paraquat-inducible protein A